MFTGQQPQVSIVLTAYNRAEPLRRTIETLLCQTFRDYELIVCDDASRDHTADVVREFKTRDKRVIYQPTDRNLGMPENLNRGIRMARGEFVANLHDGDLYAPTLLEKWIGALRDHACAAFVFNEYRFLGSPGQSPTVCRENLPSAVKGSYLLEQIYFRRWRFDSPVWGTVMARRSAYLQAGLFDNRFGCIADVDMWMRLAETYDVAYVSEPLITLPSHESVPRNFEIPQKIARQIFWEARLRHFEGQPLRLFMEAGRHTRFATYCSAYRGLCRLRRTLRRVHNHSWENKTGS